MSTPVLLVYADVGTAVAAAVESYLYRSSVDWSQCTKQALIGIVSRYVQYYVMSMMPAVTANFTANQKAEFVVFIVSAVYHRLMDKKKSSLLAGFRTAQADLMGSELCSFFGLDPDSPLIGAMGTAGAGPGYWPFSSPTAKP